MSILDAIEVQLQLARLSHAQRMYLAGQMDKERLEVETRESKRIIEEERTK